MNRRPIRLWALAILAGAMTIHAKAAEPFERLSQQIAELKVANRLLNEGAIWSDDHLFVSEPVVERDGRLIRLLADDFPHAPLTWAWCKRFGLPIERADLKSRDADRDGFSHLEEFKAGTSPVDAMECPSPVAKLRYDGFAPSGVSVTFGGVLDERDRLQLTEATGERRQMHLVEVGEELQLSGWRFRVLDHRIMERAHVSMPDLKVDVSVVTLATESGAQVRLLEDVAWPLPSGKGVVHDRSCDKNWIVAPGDEVRVSLAPEDPLRVKGLDEKSLWLKSADGMTTRLKFTNR